MLTIDRLVLHLPAELVGREASLGRAIGAARAAHRPARAFTAPRLAAALRDVSPTMDDAAIADAVVRAVAERLSGGSGHGCDRGGPAP